MEKEHINNKHQTTTMGEENAPPVMDSDEQFPALGMPVDMPSSPPKTRRSTRKSGDITATPERDNTTNSKSAINSVTPTADGQKLSRSNKDPKKSKQQQRFFAFFDNRKLPRSNSRNERSWRK